MEQFRHVGEVLGSLRALMLFRDDIKIHRRQCFLLLDALDLAFDVVAEEMKKNLRFEEKLTKWGALEGPFRELYRVFKEGENFIRQFFETKDWLAKAISLSHNSDCVNFHLHNLFWCIAIVLEAIEYVAEISGTDQEVIQKKRLIFLKKYDREWLDPELFYYKFGKQYLLCPSLTRRLSSVWKEDKWLLSELISERMMTMSKQESQLAELLLAQRGKLFPSSLLVGSKDYHMRRRLGNGSHYKEIYWMGESFAVKHFMGEYEQLTQEISIASSIRHPNIMHVMYAFSDEDRRECFLVMELMSKSLSSYIKEVCSSKRRLPFPILVAVDIMLQIARGMEYLHSREIYHGHLNTCNILVRPRSSTPEGYLHIKVTGFGLLALKNLKHSTNQLTATDPCIWHAPEVLLEQEQSALDCCNSCTEKADVYSFGMICFQLLTGKTPFEDDHLQGDKMSRNIIAGVRPLFPSPSPKCVTNIIKRCWQSDPSHRPSFASVCRMLRYIKRFLVMNPDCIHSHILYQPADYMDLEMMLSKKFTSWGRGEDLEVFHIPFQMYAYRVVERERTCLNLKERSSESGSDGTSVCDDSGFGSIIQDDCLPTQLTSLKSSLSSLPHLNSDSPKKVSSPKSDGKPRLQSGSNQKCTAAKPPFRSLSARTSRIRSESQLQKLSTSPRGRTSSGHVSDSELT